MFVIAIYHQIWHVEKDMFVLYLRVAQVISLYWICVYLGLLLVLAGLVLSVPSTFSVNIVLLGNDSINAIHPFFYISLSSAVVF